MTTYAIDIDLRRIHCVASDKRVMALNEPRGDLVAMSLATGPKCADDTVLIELASPLFYREGRRQSRSTMSWMLFNMVTAGRMIEILTRQNYHPKVLVSPSNVWTKGYTEAMRNTLSHPPAWPEAKNKDDVHELNSCWNMLWTYRLDPNLWSPLSTYLKTL